jgi:hypothetical protein
MEREFAVLDARFRELWESADVSAALVAGTEDSVMPGLLDAGLDAWMRERGESDALAFVRERQPGRNPALHAELRMIIDDRTEAQRRWAFRAIAATNAIAVLSRLRSAVTAIGLDSGTAHRQLFILRGIPWPTGKKTGAEHADFAAKGGETMPATITDLQTFAALAAMLAERHPELNAWLVARQHAHATELLSRALGDLAPADDMPAAPGIAVTGITPPGDAPEGVPEGVAPREQPPQGSPGPGEPGDTVTTLIPRSLRVGRTIPGGMALRLDLVMLRKHAVLFAGSGSGKTVMLRRIIEECALRGVSAIVLDPNNDLARLGDAWPEPPAAWSAADAELSHQYLAGTDVVVWTPRRQAGRPLAFRPLPDFAALRDEGGCFVPDEFNAAVDAAVGAIAPRLIMGKGPVKAEEEKAVLREAVRYFGESGGSDFDSLIALLDELPEGASSLPRKARATAADLAQRLRVARINDPLFAGEGEPADPGTLLTPPPGKRARVSVISMIGLPDDEQRQSFVNQLQMALFSWLRKNPSPGLGGLLVMDEAQSLVPSDKATACTESTLRLTAQARKFGLGLLFATQAPKGVHNRIPGNATTQFYGLLNSPVQISAARELARAKASDVPDIGRLSRGQFYVATEGTTFVKVATPLCLSHHPDGPLTEEQVIARARR